MKDIMNSSKSSSIKSGDSIAIERMTRFSLHEDDTGAGPSARSPSRSPTPKKRRTTLPYYGYVFPEPAQDEEEIEAEEDEEYEEDEDVMEPENEEEDDGEEEEEIEPENEEVTVTVTDRVSEGPICRGSIPVTLTDPDVLDCPICFNSLTIPVYQCENGHIACASCCTNISNKCPSCAMPIGYNRCRALEKVLESVRVPCPNTKYGCKESLIYSNLNEHEATCICTPCQCPLRTCMFLGSSKEVYAHFGERHSPTKRIDFNSPKPITLKKNQMFLFLQERSEGIIFVLNHHNDRLGSVVNIVCIAPRSSKRRFPYKLIARDGDNTSIKLHSVAENIPEWSTFVPLKIFLLVPSDITNSRDQLKFEVCINAS